MFKGLASGAAGGAAGGAALGPYGAAIGAGVGGLAGALGDDDEEAKRQAALAALRQSSANFQGSGGFAPAPQAPKDNNPSALSQVADTGVKALGAFGDADHKEKTQEWEDGGKAGERPEESWLSSMARGYLRG